MRKILAIQLLTLAAIIALLLILDHQNTIASDDNPAMSYPGFNRSDTREAQKIMNFWRQEDKRTAAVERIVILDYILIVIYGLVLIFSIIARRKAERIRTEGLRRWLLFWLGAGIFLVLAGALIDVIQDSRIYSYVISKGPVTSLDGYTTIKWAALIFGAMPLLISGMTKKRMTYVSGLLKTVWTFFPSLLFIFLTIFCFWIQGQGKDIMIAFTEGTRSFNWNLIIFFLAIGFWVYVTWYSSRVIAYIKNRRSNIPGNFLDKFPRLAGNACFLVLELAVLQSPLLENPLPSRLAWFIFILALVGLYFVDRWISGNLNIATKTMSNRFWIVFATFLLLLVITAFSSFSRNWYTLFVLLLIFHVVYIFYINLHHVALQDETTPARRSGPPRVFAAIMNYFFVPQGEAGFFKWYILLTLAALVIDILAIWWLGFSRNLGPFPLLILAFSMLLAFVNVVTAFSVRYTINFHLLLFLIAFFFGLKETHFVRTKALGHSVNGYASRPSLENYLKTWLKRLPPDTTTYDMYFVLANGGASRSGYWTASVLGKLEDASLFSPSGKFSDHLFCLSGTSGGGVGVATFFSLLNDRRSSRDTLYRRSAAQFLQQDYFTYTAARMLGPDYFNYIFHLLNNDRGAALEESFEKYDTPDTLKLYKPHFDQPFSWFKTFGRDSSVLLPVLFVNTTRMQDGNPGLVTNLRLDTTWFNQRIDVLGLLDSTMDITMASGAILGARFPYLSPAGRIGTNYFVDGGYFDNSGAGVVQELIRGIINIGRDDSTLSKKIHRLNFRVLHILNSPIVQDSTDQRPVAPIKNDLFAPLATIVGAYGMQTTVNDGRLKSYVRDIKKYYGISAEYTQISLYKDLVEWTKDPRFGHVKKEPAYSMNWFMSDSTRHRIESRLDNQPKIDSIIQRFKSAKNSAVAYRK